jgi:NTE family protein
MPKSGLVLAGGEIRGAYQVGALKAVHESRERPYDVVVGVSVGALNGALVAQGDVEKLEQLWRSLTGPRDLIRRWPLWRLPFRRSLYSNASLRGLIRQYLDPDKLRASPTELHIGATCLQTGRLVFFDKHYHDLEGALLASAAVPFLFEPIELDGRDYVDGGVVSDIPIRKAIELGCTELTLVLTSPKDLVETTARYRGIKMILGRTVEIMVRAKEAADLELSDYLRGAAPRGPLGGPV